MLRSASPPDDCITLLDRAHSALASINYIDTESMGTLHGQYARCYNAKGDYAKAQQHIDLAVNILRNF